MDIRVQFGRRLRDLRSAQGMTQEGLAERADMDVTYLSDLERGKWNPSLAMIVDLGRALRVHPSELLSELKVPTKPASERKRPKN